MHPGRDSSTKPFISKHKCRGINYSSKIDDWKTFGKNNPANTFNTLCIKKKEICPGFISKLNSNCEKKSVNDSKRRNRSLA